MFVSPLAPFSLVIAIAAFAFARRAYEQAARLRARLDAIEATTSTAAKGPMPPPLPQQLERTAAPAPGFAAPQPVPADPVRPPHVTAATPAPLLPAEPGFEERIGTRWVV